MKNGSRKLALRRETLAPMHRIDSGIPGGAAPPRPTEGPAGLRASSRACLRASAYSIASAATAISTYFLTRGC
jgi:hypothetical protein